MNEWTGTWRKTVEANSEPDTASWPSASSFNSNLRDRHAEWIGRNDRESAREKGSLPMSKHTLLMLGKKRENKSHSSSQRAPTGYLPRVYSHLHGHTQKGCASGLAWGAPKKALPHLVDVLHSSAHVPPWKSIAPADETLTFGEAQEGEDVHSIHAFLRANGNLIN